LQTGVVPEQVVPHVPQFAASVSLSTQTPLQFVSPGPQQTPDEHVSPVAHAWPHMPQLLLSVIGSLHVPPQLLLPVVQHSGFVPPLVVVQVWLAVHVVPQAPQFCSSVPRSLQTPLHAVWPVVQHVPFEQS
jgi:hypothetical protein